MPIIAGMTFAQLIKYYGSQAQVARELGIRAPSVCAWQELGIPFLRQCHIEAQTNGALTANKNHYARTRKRP